MLVWNSCMCLLTYPAVGSTTRSGIPVDAPWFTAGPSWSRINTSSWQISVTKWRCSYKHTDQRETWNMRAADKHFSRNQTLILCFSPELCRCDRSGQLTWLWSGKMHVNRKNMFVSCHFYCCFEWTRFKVMMPVTHNPRSSSWERVYWLNWSWGRLCSRPEDKETDTVIFITQR